MSKKLYEIAKISYDKNKQKFTKNSTIFFGFFVFLVIQPFLKCLQEEDKSDRIKLDRKIHKKSNICFRIILFLE